MKDWLNFQEIVRLGEKDNGEQASCCHGFSVDSLYP